MIIILLSNSFIFVLGRVAQLVEQLTFNQWVTGSNPVALTTFPHLDSGSKYNDLANNSLKKLPNLKHTYHMYRRDGDKLTENWIFIDFLHYWKMLGDGILANI